MIVKPLKWTVSSVGVDHKVADGANGMYHVWGAHYWAGPWYRVGDDVDYAEDAVAAANAAHAERIRRFVKKGKHK